MKSVWATLTSREVEVVYATWYLFFYSLQGSLSMCIVSRSVVLLSYEELMKEDDIKSQNTRYEFEQIRTDIDLVITEEWKRIWANSTCDCEREVARTRGVPKAGGILHHQTRQTTTLICNAVALCSLQLWVHLPSYIAVHEASCNISYAILSQGVFAYG